MNSQGLTSEAGLTIQFAGIVVITVLSLFITRSMRRTSLDYWAWAWACLSLALGSLLLGFTFPSGRVVFLPFYYLGEYAFALLFIAGCRNRASGARLHARDLRFVPVAIAFALTLAFPVRDFNTAFIPHAAILCFLFVVAYRALRPARPTGPSRPGFKVMSVALILLALDFFHYIVVFSFSLMIGHRSLIGYLRYTSIYDLILEMLLGFGTVMLVMDDARQAIEQVNRELTTARDRLEVLVRVDPLTEALNRHAFYSLVETEKPPANMQISEVAGCAIIVDIDNLKPINDSNGHSVGDDVIRGVASVIRSQIRANDLLFRWGGDEFLILLFGVAEPEARSRVKRLNPLLENLAVTGAEQPVTVTVSYGVAPFTSLSGIERAIDRADGNMYSDKSSRKNSGETASSFIAQGS
jgi:diguanylate cyclase (GGDEF)-like protein